MAVSFRSKLLATHAAVALVAGAVALLLIERSLSGQLEAQLDHRLEGQGRALAAWLERARHYDQLTSRLAGVVGAHVIILDEHGIAVGDSERTPGTPAGMDPDGVPPEVVAARAGKVGHATRYSATDREFIRYVALAAPRGLVVRLGVPLAEIESTRASLRRRLAVGAGISLAIAAGLGALLASALSTRLRATSALAERIARGDYEVQPGGGPVGALDEVGLLAQTLASSAAQLRDTEARRREFLANVAHELRTPITSISGYAETLASGTVDDATRAEFLHTLHRNAVRLTHLVDELLELEALQASKPALATEPVDLVAVVRNVLATARHRIEHARATAKVEAPAELVVEADADAIERIVQNLVVNAIVHGGDGVTVKIAIARRDGKAIVSVADDGPGIAPELLSRVFERFVRGATGRERERGGTGLGLAIARQLAESMGGRLSVASDPEHAPGAVFTLELPV